MKRNKNKTKKLILLFLLASSLLFYSVLSVFAQEEEMGDAALRGNPYYDPTKGTMVTPNEDKKTSTSSSIPSNGQLYQNIEMIPGAQERTSEFPTYMKQIIGFGFAIIGILAMFMLCVGAYQYLMAAGNLAKVESAKETIASALLGLALGLTAWIILKTINPDLVKLELSGSYGVGGGSSGGGSSGGGGGGGGGGGYSGTCDAWQGACSQENLACFGSNAETASRICGYESSGGNPFKLSGIDKCRDGKSFSVGLFQINLTWHKFDGLDCPSAFSAKNYNCTVINESLYQQCVSAAQSAQKNIAYACQISNGGTNWSPWRNTVNKCKI